MFPARSRATSTILTYLLERFFFFSWNGQDISGEKLVCGTGGKEADTREGGWIDKRKRYTVREGAR